jgi:hypothetical protein
MKIRHYNRKGITPARAGMALLTAALAGAGMGGSDAGAALSGQCGTIASIAAPASIVPGSLENNDKLQLFTEARQKTLTKNLAVDFTQPGLYNADDQLLLPAARPTIPAGTVVSSFLIHSDPVGLANPGQRLTATVNFTSDILGVMAQNDRSPTFYESDVEVGATGLTDYPKTIIKERGLELSSNPNVVVDWVRLSARSIQVSVLTSTVVDEIRVITKGDGDLAAKASGYQMVASDGGVFSFGNREFRGSTGAISLNSPIVAAASPCSGGGYWLAAADGGIFAFGDAKFRGSTGDIKLTKPIVGMASTPTGNGYWMVASDGGIFSFGDAKFRGSTGDIKLTKPIVGMASTPTGNGYWLVASDGGIFAFGDAKFYGSTGAISLNQPIVDMVVSPSGAGYSLVASDGGIFSYGDAAFYGSTGAIKLTKPIVAAL